MTIRRHVECNGCVATTENWASPEVDGWATVEIQINGDEVQNLHFCSFCVGTIPVPEVKQEARSWIRNLLSKVWRGQS